MTSVAEPVLVVDLDDTLLDGNSFPVWVRWLLAGRMDGMRLSRRLVLSARVAVALGWRKLARTPHARFKARLQELWAEVAAHEASMKPLIGQLAAMVRPSLMPLLERIRGNEVDAVLATAAAEEYARPLARYLGFRHMVATPFRGRETLGEEKRARTFDCLEQLGWQERPVVLFTDHLDDLPLVEKSHTVIWFGSVFEIDSIYKLLPMAVVVHVSMLNDADLVGIFNGVNDHPKIKEVKCGLSLSPEVQDI